MKAYYIEPPKQERKYRRMEKLGAELGVPVPRMHLEMQVIMPDGKVVHHHKQRSHSWTRNAYNLILAQLGGASLGDATFGAGLLSAKATTGTVHYSTTKGWSSVQGSGGASDYSIRNPNVETYGFRAGAGEDEFGILIGTSDTAEDFSDYILGAKVEDGTGAGQMSHILTESIAQSYNSGTKTWTCSQVRFINNNSGGGITIKEAGLFFKTTSFFGSNTYYFMAARDVLSPAVLIPDTGQLKTTYAISLVFPD